MTHILRVLLVEDMPDDVEMIRVELEMAGYEVVSQRVETAESLAGALDGGAWDLLISDFNLPTFDAHGALKMLKEKGLEIPFIVVSGQIGEETAVALMKAGASDYVIKGKLARLAPVVERELREAEGRRKHRLAEKALKEQEELLRQITSAMGEGLIVQGLDGSLIAMNAEAEHLLGWTDIELSARNVHETIHPVSADGTRLPREDCPVHQCLRDGVRRHASDHVFARKDGSLFPVDFTTSPIMEDDKVFAAVTTFRDITIQQRAASELLESRRQLREHSRFLQMAREAERKRIAREMHDEMGQTLTALRIDLDWLEARMPSDEKQIADKLSAMRHLVSTTVDTMRRISEDLRPGMLDDLGLAAAIEHHVTRFMEQTGIECELSMDKDEYELDDQVATAIFRILQESLTNVARHAGASRVTTRLQQEGDELTLTVTDNGRGLPDANEKTKKSYGLLGMRERVKMFEGRLETISTPGQGTCIKASIPICREEVEEQ